MKVSKKLDNTKEVDVKELPNEDVGIVRLVDGVVEFELAINEDLFDEYDKDILSNCANIVHNVIYNALKRDNE